MNFRVLTSILFILILFFSCTRGSQQISELEKQANRLLSSNPDSALKVIDSAMRSAAGSGASQAAQIRLLLMRQQAFAKIMLMDSVISSGVRIRQLAEQVGDSLSMAKSLLPIRGEVSIADQQELEPYLPGAVRTFARNGMRYEESVIEGLMGSVATRKGRFSESMQHLYKARAIQEGLDSVKPLYSVYMNIGNNLSAMGDFRGSLVFYGKAVEVARRLNDSVRIVSALMNKGVARSDMGAFDSSRLDFQEGLANLPAKGGSFVGMQLRFNFATLMSRQGRTAEAESEYRKILATANAMGDPVAIGIANNGLAGVMGFEGRYGPAIALLESTVQLFDSLGMGHYAIDYTKNLIELYRKSGRHEEGITAALKLNALSDSLLSSDKQKAVKELEAKYNYERQEEEKKGLRLQLRWRNRLAVALSFAVLGLLAFGIVLRQRNSYQRELMASYERLLEEYRMRRDATDAGFAPPIASAEKRDVTDGSSDTENLINPDEDLQAEEARVLYERIHRYFLEEKPYLDAGLKVDDLAQRFGVPSRRVTQALKIVTGQGYAEYVNRHRIDEATRIMDSLDAGYFKIDVIAAKCGFSSRQHFRRVFEQVTGVNPSYYRSRPSNKQ
jgi:AraC-like DNA-binding protein